MLDPDAFDDMESQFNGPEMQQRLADLAAQYNRRKALSLAVKASVKGDDTAAILSRAQRFQKFIDGETEQ